MIWHFGRDGKGGILGDSRSGMLEKSPGGKSLFLSGFVLA